MNKIYEIPHSTDDEVILHFKSESKSKLLKRCRYTHTIESLLMRWFICVKWFMGRNYCCGAMRSYLGFQIGIKIE